MLFFIFAGQGINHKTLCMLGKCSTAELHFHSVNVTVSTQSKKFYFKIVIHPFFSIVKRLEFKHCSSLPHVYSILIPCQAVSHSCAFALIIFSLQLDLAMT